MMSNSGPEMYRLSFPYIIAVYSISKVHAKLDISSVQQDNNLNNGLYKEVVFTWK